MSKWQAPDVGALLTARQTLSESHCCLLSVTVKETRRYRYNKVKADVIFQMIVAQNGSKQLT
jgi:hypothetical protein